MTNILRHLAIELDLDSDLDIGSMDGGSELDDRELDQPEVRRYFSSDLASCNSNDDIFGAPLV